MRILGIDYGHRSIGLAISDENGFLARGLAVIPKNQWEKEIPRIIKENQVELLVVGMPKTMDNQEGSQFKIILGFMEKLREVTGCVIARWDERLSSKLADRYLLSADLSRQKRKNIIDRLSAQIILQDYLDSRYQPSYPQKDAEEM
ncbi:MAG: Holliday junction resolvase RuvX [Candidatus Omnitrophica bacterium]|nr:Holliday junction resolvase RuvX [Candidatus Omnitrophota bacterium]